MCHIPWNVSNHTDRVNLNGYVPYCFQNDMRVSIRLESSMASYIVSREVSVTQHNLILFSIPAIVEYQDQISGKKTGIQLA